MPLTQPILDDRSYQGFMADRFDFRPALRSGDDWLGYQSGGGQGEQPEEALSLDVHSASTGNEVAMETLTLSNEGVDLDM